MYESMKDHVHGKINQYEGAHFMEHLMWHFYET